MIATAALTGRANTSGVIAGNADVPVNAEAKIKVKKYPGRSRFDGLIARSPAV
jgi:hypothetical protein